VRWPLCLMLLIGGYALGQQTGGGGAPGANSGSGGGPLTGAAGGALTGSYPNPQLSTTILPGGVANAQTSGAAAANVSTVQGHVSHVCAEDYLYLDNAHNGTDYGVAINGADAAIKAAGYQRAVIALCVPGAHLTWTPAVIDWSIVLDGTGSRLVPQSGGASGAWGAAPIVLSGCTLTAGSSTASCPSATSVSQNMAIGGLGLYESTYVSAAPSGTSIPLALPANLVINCVATSGSPTLTGCSGLRGITVGQTVSGYGIPNAATITAIDYGQSSAQASQGIALSANATAGSPVPISLAIAPGSTWIANLTAEAVAPVVTWAYNTAAPQNPYFQIVGAGLRGLWIADPGWPSSRTLTGVQGVQVYGYDHFTSYDLRVDNLAGSALILGGNAPASAGVRVPVRESDFSTSHLFYDGDLASGQPVREIMTPNEGHVSSADEDNTLGFTDLHIGCGYAEGTTIGTFNPSHTGTNGPRNITDSGNTQEEGCGLDNSINPADQVHIIQARSINMSGSDLASPGYGKSLVRVDAVMSLSLDQLGLDTTHIPTTYTVGVTHGSTTVTYVSGGTASGFDTTGTWDGIGGLAVDGASCTTAASCNVYMAPSGAVTSSTSLTLAAPYQGTTNANATLMLGIGGYFVNATNQLNLFDALGNNYSQSPYELQLLGLGTSYTSEWNVGSAFPGAAGQELLTDFNEGFLYSGSNGITTTGLALTGQAGNVGKCAYFQAGGVLAATTCGLGSTVYPGAGVANSTGSAWGSSYTVGAGANNLVQLNGSAQLPAVSGANLTNLPTTDTTARTAPAFFPQSIAAGAYNNFFDDFVTTSNMGTTSIGSPSGQSCGASFTFLDNTSPGTLADISGSVSGAGEACVPAGGNYLLANATTSPSWTWESRVYVPVLPSSTAGSYQAGLVHSYNASPWTSGIGFYLSSANGVANDWYCRYNSTSIDSTVAVTAAWTRLSVYNDGTLVHWYINGNPVCGAGVPITNMPSTTLLSSFTSVAGSTTSVTMALDYWMFHMNVTR
jgi:hypothetical protein